MKESRLDSDANSNKIIDWDSLLDDSTQIHTYGVRSQIMESELAYLPKSSNLAQRQPITN